MKVWEPLIYTKAMTNSGFLQQGFGLAPSIGTNRVEIFT